MRSFCARAWNDLAGIRNGILIFLQDRRSVSDLNTPIRDLYALKQNALDIGLADIADHIAECERVLNNTLKGRGASSDGRLRLALDIVAEIEASLLKTSLRDDEHFPDVSKFIDESFEKLTQARQYDPIPDEPDTQTGFEIDEETLEIFRSEASDLLENISANLKILTAQPNERDALWNIRRCAHTFKGAAGIVGMKEASELAHRVEDLLDQLAEDPCEIDTRITDLIVAATDHLNSMTIDTGTTGQRSSLPALYEDFDRVISENSARHGNPTNTSPTHSAAGPSENTTVSENSDFVKPLNAPIVRVALARMDELLKISQDLDRNQAILAERFAGLGSLISGDGRDMNAFENLVSLFENQHRLTLEMQDKLLQIRMVRFGMLTTRLNRAVHVTCQEENKKASLIIENEDVEIDTQILDSLVEPLLHLLRNAVVHGIERPEMRRLIGKSETGQIKIAVENNFNSVIVSVRDDGRGISAVKLKEKAVSSGAIDRESVGTLTDQQAFDLMFLRGVTTAETLSLNAGRGVGMSIVKESVESGGGSISITSEAQKGTTFTIRMPITLSVKPFDPVGNGERLSGLLTTAHGTALTVLIVEDSLGMRQLITKIIEKAGWKAIVAADGLEAIEILSVPENRPDIILTDLEMPRLNGYELLEAIKNNDDLCEIPVVMITSRADDEHRQKAFDLGAAEFVTKPFEGSSLIRMIEQLCVAATKTH